VWNTCKKVIRDEHSLQKARAELERLWKERVAKDIASKAAQQGGGAAANSDNNVLPMEEGNTDLVQQAGSSINFAKVSKVSGHVSLSSQACEDQST
jgi:hypothetical protein